MNMNAKPSIMIPVPDNPMHVSNLESIELLEAQGFEGTDAILEISLSEYGYGFAWRHLDNGEYLFVYRNEHRTFDRATFKADTDVEKEWDWALREDNGEQFFSAMGITREEWMKSPLPLKLYDLYTYYGAQNILGTTYWTGWKITNKNGEVI